MSQVFVHLLYISVHLPAAGCGQQVEQSKPKNKRTPSSERASMPPT